MLYNIVFVSHKFVEAMPKGWWRACYFLTFTFERFLLMCEHLNEPEQLLNTSACCFHFAFNYIHFLRIFFILFMENVFARRSTAVLPSRE